MKYLRGTILWMMILYANMMLAEKGFVFKPDLKTGQSLIEKGETTFLESKGIATTVNLSIKPHPLDNEYLYLEVLIKLKDNSKSFMVDPKSIHILYSYKNEGEKRLSCLDPLMLARLYEGIKSVGEHNQEIEQARYAEGDSIAEVKKMKIRLNAEKLAKPEWYGLLNKNQLDAENPILAGLVNFPMLDKKCEEIKVEIPLENEIHTFHFQTISSKDVKEPDSPLIEYFANCQSFGFEGEIKSAVAILNK